MLLIKIKTLFFQFESEEQSFCMHHLLSDLTRSHRKRLTPTLMSHVLNVIFRHKQAVWPVGREPKQQVNSECDVT